MGKLYDLNNAEKCKVLLKDNKAQIDITGLKKGIYIVKINFDGQEESHQVIVN